MRFSTDITFSRTRLSFSHYFHSLLSATLIFSLNRFHERRSRTAVLLYASQALPFQLQQLVFLRR
jgi:hypothetical protein